MARISQTHARIHSYRISQNLTQEQQARCMGIHRVTLAKLERYRLWPGMRLRGILARTLGCTVDDILDEYRRHRKAA